MSRSYVALLMVVCALLVFDGPAARAPRDDRADRAEGVFDAARIERELRLANPSLSASELRRISAAVEGCGERYALEPELVTAVLLKESSARPWARSHKGAVGLMQVMPHMFGALDLPGNLTTIESNIEAGCVILADNIRRLGEERGISAYFWGSKIRGASYLRGVQKTREALRALPESES